ncbi:MAG: hypothetical protein GY729_01830 [Desulfobacteraceae bacterium]|nr:hypothetical protein [Desulfobacteraceae bacterium]
MKINTKIIKTTGLVTLLFSFWVFLANPALGNTPKKVAIFPFTMNSPQDLSFLQNGLYSMLSSRLADPGKVVVLEKQAVEGILKEAQKNETTKGEMNESKARMIGANINVDYVLFGSLTHFGESISLDANMVDVTGQKPTLSFFKQSNNLGDVIPLVNTFAGDVNQKVFNRSISNELYARPQQGQQAPGGSFQYTEDAQNQYPGGTFVDSRPRSKGFMTHLTLQDFITSMAAADVDNDGKIEVVVATETTIQIFRAEGNQLVLEKKLEYDSSVRIVRLDIADINGNGYPEIFATSLSIHLDDLSSFVVEYTGTQYKTLVDDETIYYGILDDKKAGTKRLIGQSIGRNPFDARIYNMDWDNNRYKKEKRIRMPRNISVLSIAKGAATLDGKTEYVGLNKYGRLTIFSETGAIEWEGNEKHGGSGHYFLLPRNDTDGSFRERVYLQPRVIFYDFDSKDNQELVVIKNQELGGGSFGRIKRFYKGNIQVLSWNGIALSPLFQTQSVQGWISDIAIADFDDDGIVELITAVVDRDRSSFLKQGKKSNIISYDLK